MKEVWEDEQEQAEPQPDGWDDPKNYRKTKRSVTMGLGNKKSSKSSGKGGGKKDNSSKRYVASIWQNEGKGDKPDYLSMSIDNLDPDSEYHKGNLIWFDKETQKYYKVKSLAVYEADKGPQNLTNKIVLDLENEYHCEEMESE